MKAIVLAAGFGTRMQPLSEHLPKPLMPVVGRPLLWHTITKLISSKVEAVGVNCHHKAAMIQDYVRSAGFSVPVTLSPEPVILGSGGGIGGFRKFLSDEEYCTVHNGDMLSNIAIDAAHEAYRRDMPLAAMVLHDAPGFNNVCIDDSGRIIDMRDILQPAGVSRRLAYTGICFLRKDIFRYIPQGESDLVHILAGIIKKGSETIQAITAGQCAWRDVGTPSSYLQAHREILLDRRPLIDPSCMPQASIYAGSATYLGPGVECSGFVAIGNSCTVEGFCRLENSIVWDNTVLPSGMVAKNAIIGPGWSLPVQESL